VTLTLTCDTFTPEPAPATPAGTVPVTLPFELEDLLFVELPRKYAAANAAAPTATAMRMMRTVLLIPEARL
jgi:hypothetical protein